MARTAALLSWIALFAWTAAAGATPSRREVERLLGARELRLGRAQIRELGDGVDHVLAAIAVDERVPRLTRNRALSALAAVPSLEGRDLLRAVLRDRRGRSEPMDLLDVMAAARSLAAFGPHATVDLLPLLAHPVADVRQAAAESLAAAGAVDAVGSLELRITVEQDTRVVDALRHAIGQLSRR